MKPGKILFLLTITIMILFTNINIVDAKQYTYTFKKSEWTFKQIMKYKELCRASVASTGGGGGICTFYYTETPTKTAVKDCTVYKNGTIDREATAKNCAKGNVKPKKVNRTAIYDPSSKKTIGDKTSPHVQKESDIEKKTATYTSKWTKMTMVFGSPDKKRETESAGRLGAAYDVLTKNIKGCSNVSKEKEPIKTLCKEGSKITNEQRNAYLKGVADPDSKKDSEKVSEAEAKKILKGEMKSTNCKELLGDDLVEILQSLVDIVKVAVPILLIALGTLDFGKAIFSSDDNEMKKAQSKFMKRLLAAAAIFLVPSLLGVLLNLGHSIWGDVIKTDLCGIKF